MNLIWILTLLVAVVLSVNAETDNDKAPKAYQEVQLNPVVGDISPKQKIGNQSEVVLGGPREKIPAFDVSHIVRGDDAAPRKYPYQVGVIVGFGTDWYFYCGGTLIGHEWVITAAHCTDGAHTIEVRLGSVLWDKPRWVSWGYENYTHPNYGKKNGDIALVKIDWVDYNRNILPAYLPSLNDCHEQYMGARVVATGWGNTDDNGGKTNLLKYATMRIIDTKECANAFGPKFDGPGVICTGSKDTGATCSGDSGGPLVLENTRLLIGVTSFGALGNCTKGLPDGFTRITYYLDWIEDITGIYY